MDYWATFYVMTSFKTGFTVQLVHLKILTVVENHIFNFTKFLVIWLTLLKFIQIALPANRQQIAEFLTTSANLTFFSSYERVGAEVLPRAEYSDGDVVSFARNWVNSFELQRNFPFFYEVN